MEFFFCPTCGEKLVKRPIGDEGLVPFCENCHRPWFPFSYPCVICLCVDEKEHIALIKQAYVSERFVCVAGYVKPGEAVEHTAKREVEEETGLSVLDVQYVGSYPYEKRDNLMLGFVCRVKHGDFALSGEVDHAAWFTPQEAEVELRKGSVGKDLLRDYRKMLDT